MTITLNESFIHLEAFNVLCGELIGEGAYRKVFDCPFDPTIVIKVENAEFSGFHNALEWRTWDECIYWKPGNRWLAPCVRISPNGRILIQRKTEPIRPKDLPAMLPSFLRDVKPGNFGWYDGRIVCHDYAFTGSVLPIKMKKADWNT